MTHLPGRTENDFSPESLASLWIASYRFSQGSPLIQKSMLKILQDEIIPTPELEESGALEESFELAQERIKRIINSDAHVGGNGSSSDTVRGDFTRNVIDTLRGSEPIDPETHLEIIAKMTLERDAKYMLANGRHNERKFAATSGNYFSYATRYILLQAGTRQPLFDNLFEQTRPKLAAIADEPIQTYRSEEGEYGLVMVPGDSYRFHDVIEAHISSNLADGSPVQQALAELSIPESSKEIVAT